MSRERFCNMKDENAVQINNIKIHRWHHQLKQSTQECDCKKCEWKCKTQKHPAFGKTFSTKCPLKNRFAVRYPQSSKNIHEIQIPGNEINVYTDFVITVLL